MRKKSDGEKEKGALKRRLWTKNEDGQLILYICAHGCRSWREIAANSGLERCQKSCRLRWMNYLRPDIKRGMFSVQEDREIIRLHTLLGNRWSIIAANLPNRTDNEIKNYWNTRLKKRLVRMGIDPITHRPKENIGKVESSQATRVDHMAQWEIVRIQTESQLILDLKISSMLQPRWNLNMVGNSAGMLVDVLQAWQTMRSLAPMSLEIQNLASNFSKNNNISTKNGDFGIKPIATPYSSGFDSTSEFNFMNNYYLQLSEGTDDLIDNAVVHAVANVCYVMQHPWHGTSTTPYSMELNFFGFNSNDEVSLMNENYLLQFEENGDH